MWGRSIRLDPKWKGGHYDDDDQPVEGLTAAFEAVTLHANQSAWARGAYGRAPAALDKDPAQALDNSFKIEAALRDFSATRAAVADANTFLYMVRANQLACADPARIRTPALIISSPTDLVFPPDWIERTVAAIRGNGTPVETETLSGPNGHLNGLLHIAQAGPRIAAFLAG
jgi:homoserine O-acetyltransferase